MAHIKITIDIPDDSDFLWGEAFDLWRNFMPNSDGGYNNSQYEKLTYTWSKEIVDDLAKKECTPKERVHTGNCNEVERATQGIIHLNARLRKVEEKMNSLMGLLSDLKKDLDERSFLL